MSLYYMGWFGLVLLRKGGKSGGEENAHFFGDPSQPHPPKADQSVAGRDLGQNGDRRAGA